MLKENEERLYNLLIISEDYKTFDDLANEMNVTKRTIYNLIERIEPFVKKNNFFIDRKYGFGIKVSVIDKDFEKNGENNIHTSIDYRREVIKLKLIFDYKNLTSINEICNQFNLTKNSVILDLNFIEYELKRYNLKLQKNHLGTKIVGKRKNLKAAIIDSCHKFGTDIIYKNYDLFKKNEKLNYFMHSKKLEKILIKGLEKIKNKFNYELNMDYFHSLLIHLIIDLVIFGEEEMQREKRTSSKTPGEWLQLYIENKLNIKFNKSYNLNRLDEYLISFSICQNYSKSSIERITELIINNFSYITKTEYSDEETISTRINYIVGKILLRKKYRIGVFHPFLHYLVNINNEEFIALGLAVHGIGNEFGSINADELSFLLIELLNASFIKTKRIKINLQTNYGNSNIRFIKSIIEQSNKAVSVQLAEYDKNKRLNLIHDENNKYYIDSQNIYANILNPTHLSALNEEINEEIKNEYRKKIKNYEVVKKELSNIANPNKMLIMNKIYEYLIKNNLLEVNTDEQFISAGYQLPLYWLDKKTAIVIHENNKKKLKKIINFPLNYTVKWSSQNELSHVNKIIVLLTDKIDIKELECLYNSIKCKIL